MVRRSGDKAGAGWNPRILGVVICAFFVLGVLTGFSGPGRAVTLRTIDTLRVYRDQAMVSSAPARAEANRYLEVVVMWATRAGILPARARISSAAAQVSSAGSTEGAIAIVARRDGFYALFDSGELRGPVSVGKQGDLAILSGPALENASGATMVEYAAVLVRAETRMSELISEMRVDDDATASMFLERERTELVIDIDRAPAELQRALEVRHQWQGRENLIAALDMTTPGQAVVKLRGVDPIKRKTGFQKVSTHFPDAGKRQLRAESVTR